MRPSLNVTTNDQPNFRARANSGPQPYRAVQGEDEAEGLGIGLLMRGSKRASAFNSQSCLTCSALLLQVSPCVRVLDELTAQGHHHPARPQQLGLQDLMEVESLLVVPLHQAVRTVPPLEADQAEWRRSTARRPGPCRRSGIEGPSCRSRRLHAHLRA